MLARRADASTGNCYHGGSGRAMRPSFRSSMLAGRYAPRIKSSHFCTSSSSLKRTCSSMPSAEKKTFGGDDLPAGNVHMRAQVFLPDALHDGLESQHKNLLPAHTFSQLIGGKGLAEAHVGVAQEVRRLAVFAAIKLWKQAIVF